MFRRATRRAAKNSTILWFCGEGEVPGKGPSPFPPGGGGEGDGGEEDGRDECEREVAGEDSALPKCDGEEEVRGCRLVLSSLTDVVWSGRSC